MMEILPKPIKSSSAYTTVKRFAKIIKNFCTHGNPATDFTPNWQPLQSDKTHVLDFGKEVAVKRCPEEQRMKLWQKILDFDKRNTHKMRLKTM